MKPGTVDHFLSSFFNGKRVFTERLFIKAKHVQLRCYFSVAVRQKPESSLVVLADNQIAEWLKYNTE
ncbi:hypothetical protein GGQ79_004691 [Ochrobactrum pecoris]|uniref:Uncharacterized protein n=1 Tax=Brucella pecoris TaxID=867683 RepID=A0AB34YYB2_9HYPH|nr:hypothetical protein [Brucella pecoris]